MPALINEIIDSCKNIYDFIEDHPDEKYYQTFLNTELQDLGYFAQNEVNVTYNYKTVKGNYYPISDRLNGRIDILLPNEKLIIEIKRIGNCDVAEFAQIRRYMREYYPKWNEQTKGLLINFGKKELEIFFMYYEEGKIICEKRTKYPKSFFVNIIDKTPDIIINTKS